MADDGIIADLEARAAEHEAEARRYRAAIAALRGDSALDFVGPTMVAQAKHPRTRRRTGPSSTMSMIRAVTADAVRPMDAHDITNSMLARGWPTTSKDPVNTVRTALARLVERGDLVRDARGLFSANPDSPTINFSLGHQTEVDEDDDEEVIRHGGVRDTYA